MALGDHLVVQFGWYRHHGIDVGEGKVVHFGRGLHDLENAQIEVVPIQDFAQGKDVLPGKSEASFPPEAIRERALSRLGESGYNLETNNCEHFANWCRNGVMSSPQSDVGETVLRQGVASVTKPVVAAGLKRLAAQFLKNGAGRGVLLKSLGKATPALLIADAAQFVTELTSTACGRNKEDSRKLGIRTGASVSAVVGFAAAGGVGSLAGVATWIASQKLGETFVRKLNKASHPEPGVDSEQKPESTT